MSTASRLRSLDFLSHFTDEQILLLSKLVSVDPFPAGTLVFRQGDKSRDAYVIDRGRLHIRRQTAYGAYKLAELEEGELFGETSFVDGDSRSGDAVADVDSELLIFKPERLDLQDQTIQVALYWSFWRSLSKKLRETNEQLTRFFAKPGVKPTPAPLSPKEATGEFQLDLQAKRELFQEQKLSTMEINFLASLSQERKLAPNQVLFQEGDVGDKMYVVLDGRVLISKQIPGAGEEALAFMERGDYFGEMALIDNRPRSADARAYDTGAVLLAIPRDVLEGILDINLKMSSLRLLKILTNLIAKRLRELDEKLTTWYIFSGGESSGAGGA